MGHTPDKATAPVYAESINMLEGLTEEEANTFLQENPTPIFVYEIGVMKEVEPYQYFVDAAAVELLRVGFIRLVKRATWLSPIMVVPKKNKLWVCVDYRKLNATTIMDAFPLPFTDGVLDIVTGHEIYNFLDWFSGYNQIRMAKEDQEKTAFVIEWGVFVAVIMMFRLKTAPATFHRG
jgi:hypothetical protein